MADIRDPALLAQTLTTTVDWIDVFVVQLEIEFDLTPDDPIRACAAAEASADTAVPNYR